MELPKNAFYKKTLDEEQQVFFDAIKNDQYTIVFCNAAAGTGKTTIAMGAANILVQDRRNKLDEIVYIVSPYGEQKQGYLPGDITAKSEVYYEPAYQALTEVDMNPYNDVTNRSLSEKRKPNDGTVKPMTHTYMRGTNLQNKVVIIDEAQNFTLEDLKKVLTRCHDSCKVIVIGHTGQIDIKGSSGFAKYLKWFEGHPRCAVCSLSRNYRGWLSTYADRLEG